MVGDTTIGSVDPEHMTPDQILASLGVTPADLKRVASYGEYVAPRMDDYVESWVAWMLTRADWRRFFSTDERLARVRQTQREYWGKFFTGIVDEVPRRVSALGAHPHD